MATELSRQLAVARQLASTPSTQGQSGKIRSSLLFEKHEAADYDRTTIYHLGLNGLQELIQSGAVELQVFREPLFSQTVAAMDRHLETKEVSDQLDNMIDRLVLALSPYFLRRSCFKVLEYLVRHFQAHIHNVDALCKAALPYHDTNSFVKLIVLPLAIQDTRWAFLKNIVKSKEPLTRQQLVKVCLSNTPVLKAVCDMVKVHPENSKLISFFAVLSCQVIEQGAYGKKGAKFNTNVLDSSIVPTLVPIALEAMRTKDHPELQRAGYLIVSQLATHATLSDKASTLFLLSSTRKATPETLPDALKCSSIVLYTAATNGTVKTLPEKTVSRFVKGFEEDVLGNVIEAAFSTTAAEGADTYFVEDLYVQLVEKNPLLLQKLIVRCSPMSGVKLFKQLAKAFNAKDPKLSTRVKSSLKQTAHQVALKCPDDIDTALAMSKSGTDHDSLVAFASTCYATSSGGQGELITNKPIAIDGEDVMTIRLALHHPNATVRERALVELAKSKVSSVETVGIDVLLDRIQDEKASVVEAALEFALVVFDGKQDGISAKQTSKMLSSVNAAINSWQNKYSSIVTKSIQLVGKLHFSEQQNIVDALLLLLEFFPLTPEKKTGRKGKGKKSAPCVDTSDFPFQKHAMEAAVSVCKDVEGPAAEIACVFDVDSNDEITLQDIIGHVGSSAETSSALLALCSRALEVRKKQVCIVLAAICAQCMGDNADVALTEMAAVLCTSTQVWKDSSFPEKHAQVIGWVLNVLICEKMDAKADGVNKGNLNLSEDTPCLALRMLCILLAAPEIAYKTICTQALQSLLDTFFNGCVLRSLALISSGEVARVSLLGQRRALILCTALINAMRDGSDGYMFLELTPYLVHALGTKSNVGVRVAAVGCAEAILKTKDCKKSYLGFSSEKGVKEALPRKTGVKVPNASSFLPFLTRVAESSNEFESDPETLGRLLRTFTSQPEIESIDTLLSRAVMMLTCSTRESDSSVSRCVENMIRPLVVGAPVAVFGISLAMLANVALDKKMYKLLGVCTQNWKLESCKLETVHINVILKGLKNKEARAIFLPLLSLPHVYNKLDATAREVAFDELCTYVVEERSAGIAPALKAIGRIPFGAEVIKNKLDKVAEDEELLRVVLEAVRVRLFTEEDAVKLLEMAVQLLPSLFSLLGSELVDPLLVLPEICVNRAIEVIAEQLTTGTQKLSKARQEKLQSSLSCIKMDLVVKSVLDATTVPVRNVCLELLTNCTRVFPQKALEAVLPILSAVDEQQNAFTFVVLEHVTRCLASFQQLGDNKDAQKSPVSLVEILSLFVDACKKHSSHSKRTIGLYELLIHSCVKDNQSLWVIVVMLLHSCKTTAEFENTSGMVRDLLLRFAVKDQVAAFLEIMKGLELFMNDQDEEESGAEKDSGVLPYQKVVMFCAKKNGASFRSGFRFVKYVCQLLTDHLSSRGFMRQLHSLSTEQVERAGLHGEAGFFGLLNHIHRQVHACGKHISSEEDVPEAEKKMWGVVREELYVVLDKINALLSVPMFVAVLHELLRDQDPHVRQLAIRQLSTKVEQQYQNWRPEEVVIFLEMVDKLHKMLKSKKESNVNKQTALLSIDVLARHLGSSHQKPFIEVLPTVVAELKTTSESLVKNKSKVDTGSIQLASSACLCVGTLISVLKTRTLSQLPHYAKALLKSFGETFKCFEEQGTSMIFDDESEEQMDAQLMLAQSAASSIHSMVCELPTFMSPYLTDLLSLVGSGDAEDIPELVRVTARRIGSKLANHIEPRLLLPPLQSTLIRFAKEKNLLGARNLVTVLNESIVNMSREALSAQLDQLSSLFSNSLNIRELAYSSVDGRMEVAALNVGVVPLEEAVADSFVSMVLQLSGSQMQSIFRVMCDTMSGVGTPDAGEGASGDLFGDLEKDTAVVGEKKKREQVDDDSSSVGSTEDNIVREASADWPRQCRSQTMYLIASKLGERLQSLSIPFLNKLMESLVEDLQLKCEDTKEKELSGKAKRRRTSSQGSDDQGSDDEDTVDIVTQWRTQQRTIRERALVVVRLFSDHSGKADVDMEQGMGKIVDATLGVLDIDLHLIVKSDDTEVKSYYHQFVSDYLRPCLVEIARAGSSDDALWQTLHHGVLEFSKHASPDVRLETINTIVGLFEDVGESYIVLLADTLPTIVELMEDKEQMVKNAAHKAARKLQQLSGEDLTTFLK
uniref:HEAT repeat-containing protein 1 n=1 Tax=Mucochytrium quahogii TaxID=96639 RepID=A0A7S2WTP9_9STRA|mmetsp:Transcript_26186/g.42371  ORF Transcript_26186/g.42371 Transcript_26186/m.42371 type:complete len:2184 (-) Transcript_26186:1421-7972(-)|eukprot:CAMPEP_0203744676 /NCGR_PEP_ID=MMETSP0098-20131031/661_1 /ASSEMBLY_ACC=CAM_ASM_000208 /TAXON_ID=96639 /ORGANISM=" , Strain NY0313808BC1" /LENGTH=2183 /DNA_ID=CAMNT_0050632255 /DNA_START=118 /DNA_END=6672 /DNA_ORIENTATION=-